MPCHAVVKVDPGHAVIAGIGGVAAPFCGNGFKGFHRYINVSAAVILLDCETVGLIQGANFEKPGLRIVPAKAGYADIAVINTREHLFKGVSIHLLSPLLLDFLGKRAFQFSLQRACPALQAVTISLAE